jgi:acetyl esterase/lipase
MPNVKTASLLAAGLLLGGAAAYFGGPPLLDSGWLRYWRWSRRFRLTRSIEYASVPDGRGGAFPLLLDVYQPAPQPKRPGPAVVFLHGGGWMLGDKRRAANYLPYLALAGITAIAPNFRSSLRARFPAQLDDCRSALAWLRAHADALHIDPRRIAVMGESSGGHLAALLALDPALRLRACADWFGPADITLAAEGDWARYDTRAVKPLLGGWPAQLPELARAASPVYSVHPAAPPFLIVHGARDGKVPPAQSRRLTGALRAVGAEVAHIEVPGGGHGRFWGTRPDHKELLIRTIVFLAAALA